MAVLIVGTGQQFAPFCAAVVRARNGDTNAPAPTIQGVGGMANLVATQGIPNDKAPSLTDTGVTSEPVARRGAGGFAGNAATASTVPTTAALAMRPTPQAMLA